MNTTKFAALNSPRFTVVVWDSEGSESTHFDTEGEARAFIAEELLWESVRRVCCPALSIDERGSFH